MKQISRAIALILALMPVAALAQSAPATMPYHTVYGRIGATPGGTGPGQAIPFAALVAQFKGQITPEISCGAIGDGVTDDSVALQCWANLLRDGGVGAAPSAFGYRTSKTITFTPSTNTAPVQGPHIVGNLKLIGHASLPTDSDLLRVWNPTATTTSQNFYYAQFDSLELSRTTGVGACLSLRGYWGRIGQVFARTCGSDGVQFPNFLFGGIPDEYESNPTIGDVTCIDCLGYVVNNQIGIGATPRFSNIRGTLSGVFTNGLGAANFSGSEQVNGNISYTGGGWGVQVQLLGAGGRPHEVYLQGAGDIDCAQNGIKVQEVEHAIITGHRMNVEPPGTCNASSWPLTAYSFGKVGNGAGLLATTVNAYVTIRPGVTSGNIGTLFDFNNDTNISGLVLNVEFLDQASIISGMSFSSIYKNIGAGTAIRIIQNGAVVYDTLTASVLYKSVTAPGTPIAGQLATYSDSTNKILSSKNDAGVVSNTVVPSVAVANQFMTGIGAAGVITRSGLGAAIATSMATGGCTIGANDICAAGTSLFGSDLTVQKNQNATTSLNVTNTDTTNTSSRSGINLTGGTVAGRFLAISGNSFIVGTTTAHPISFQANSAASMTLDANSGVFVGAIGTSIPVTKTGASSSMGSAESSIIVNNAGTHTLTLLAASSNAGRWVTIKTATANTVVSATSNVVPRITAAAGTAILPATAGAWVSMQSDGTNWIIMAGTP